MTVVHLLLVLCLPWLQARPDLSGTWVFDRARSAQPWNGRIVIAAILGDECVAAQDAASLKLAITVGDQKVMAVYNFDRESRNLSPGDIPVTSLASWDGEKLTIASTSVSTVRGETLTVESRRVLWLDAEGHLVIERTGRPHSEVTPSRSVYARKAK